MFTGSNFKKTLISKVMDIRNTGTYKIGEVTAARDLQHYNREDSPKNAFTPGGPGGSVALDFWHGSITISNTEASGVALAVRDSNGVVRTIDLDPEGKIANYIITDWENALAGASEMISVVEQSFKQGLKSLTPNPIVITNFIYSLEESKIQFVLGLPAGLINPNNDDVYLRLQYRGDTTAVTVYKIGDSISELTVEDVELTFTNNDDLKVTINGTDTTDAGFNYATGATEDVAISIANAFMDGIKGSVTPQKLAYVLPVAVDFSTHKITYRIAYDSGSTVSLAVVAVAD